jgi:hypothetical protein
MISSTTPHKLADIIRDTWPGLYRPARQYKLPSNTKDDIITKYL